MPINWVVQISSQDLWASVLAKRMLWSRNGASRQHEMAKPCPKILPVRSSWTGQQKSPWPGQYFKSSRESGEELPRSLYKENILLLSAGDEKPSTPGSGPDRGFMGRVALTVKAEPEVMERTLRVRRPEPSRCMQFTDLRRRLVWAGVLPSSNSFQLIDFFLGRFVWIKASFPHGIVSCTCSEGLARRRNGVNILPTKWPSLSGSCWVRLIHKKTSNSVRNYYYEGRG